MKWFLIYSHQFSEDLEQFHTKKELIKFLEENIDNIINENVTIIKGELQEINIHKIIKLKPKEKQNKNNAIN